LGLGDQKHAGSAAVFRTCRSPARRKKTFRSTGKKNNEWWPPGAWFYPLEETAWTTSKAPSGQSRPGCSGRKNFRKGETGVRRVTGTASSGRESLVFPGGNRRSVQEENSGAFWASRSTRKRLAASRFNLGPGGEQIRPLNDCRGDNWHQRAAGRGGELAPKKKVAPKVEYRTGSEAPKGSRGGEKKLVNSGKSGPIRRSGINYKGKKKELDAKGKETVGPTEVIREFGFFKKNSGG